MVCLFSGRMEESHFNSNPYFWPSIPTVSGQVSCVCFVLPSIYFGSEKEVLHDVSTVWRPKQSKTYLVSLSPLSLRVP